MTDASIVQNRRARFEYDLSEFFEAGLALNGPEIKAVRTGRLDLSAAYARVVNGEVWLINCNISGVEDPSRTRKLLLHRREIDRLIGLAEQKGYALVPLNLHWKRGRAKVELGLGKGRKQYDKRDVIKKRDADREAARSKSERS